VDVVAWSVLHLAANDPLKSAELFRIELRARMPFRYGIATMTR